MSTFGKAFSAARKAGKSTFKFGGKSYTTKMAAATPKKGPVPGPRPDIKTKTASVDSRAAKAGKTVGALVKPKAAAKTPSVKDYPANASSRKSVSNDTARYNMAKAGPRDTPGKAFAGVKPLSIGDRIKGSIRIGQSAVDRGARRDAAAAANKDAKSAVQSMLDGMSKKTKRK
ncbi:hypothetical protein [Mesorhizobium sp. L2C067A000]|uniref:hypothetical protein n=1 Tax=Mesorhizobium sp. L2C067A000 TaxID=1287106 RepID=UPI0003CFAD10|nr:hypothetical protein [Mesorhizobium sp. L2C067A000]ESZ33856.1 hypothetical protein X733_13745 [Mesorhizobium sp. L2C067A000]